MEHLNGTPVPGRGRALRLLPWPSPEGKPSYLVTDHKGGHLSRLADDLEATQLATGTDVLDLARTVLDDPTSPYTEVRYAGIRLAECLTDTLRVAESRGLRLPAPDIEDEDETVDAETVEDEQHEPGQ
ncbi:hypothetical protein [Streptomyces sp. NBC_01314]|uniref:hypothetical protein n=1 Tax=Streptomyces sp. NBC_01314 TaxID=2903821 RepID=UPI003091A18A|nr:hypothetical protein OG622_23740 [Streptomyces sp. NBC_01314]